jgi:hypothetical protein
MGDNISEQPMVLEKGDSDPLEGLFGGRLLHLPPNS